MEECSVRPDDFVSNCNEHKFHADTISAKSYNSDYINYPNLDNFNENGIKQELQIYKSTAIYSIDNNITTNSNIRQNKISSFINEFGLFLKKYEENRNNLNDAKMESDTPEIVNETVQFMNLNEKFVSLNSTKLWNNTANASSSLTFNEDVNSTISIKPESSQESMDEITLDNSVNHTSEMKLDFIDQKDDDSDCEGYNSSDFEFISEQEAGLEGIINNYCSASQANYFKCNKSNADTETIYDLEQPGPSRLQYKSDKLESNNGLYTRCNSESDEDLNNHVIPEGEDFYELFSEPWSVYNFQAENKAFYSNKAMHFDTDIIGFNVGILHQRQKEKDVDDSIKQEALENAQKIVAMYPSENNRSKRRTRLT